MEALFAPFSEETGRLILMPAICNVLFSTAEVLLFLKRCDQHVSMRCYEIRAGNRVRLFWSQKKDLYRLWMAGSAGYASVHVLLNIIFETGTWMSVIYTLLAFFLFLFVTYEITFARVFENRNARKEPSVCDGKGQIFTV